MNAQMLQAVGEFLAGSAALIGAIVGVIKLPQIGVFFLSWTRLIGERNQAIRQARDALSQVSVMQITVENYEKGLDAVNLRVAELEKKRDSDTLEIARITHENALQSEQIDALVDYAHLLLDDDRFVRDAGTRVNADFEGRTIPTVPPILADRFGVPRSLRTGLTPREQA